MSQQLHNPLAPTVIMADMENEPEPQATMVVEQVWQLSVNLFEILLMGVRNTGMANGLWVVHCVFPSLLTILK